MLSSFNDPHIPLRLKIDSLHMSALDRWNATSSHLNASFLDSIINKVHLKTQQQNEIYIRQAFNTIMPLIRTIPEAESDFIEWRQQLSDQIKTIILDAPFLSDEEKAFMSNDQFVNLSDQFIQQALSDVPTLDFEGIGQGLRNLWIAGMLQARFGCTIELTPSLYGYSMLYPLTDTVMDNSSLSSNDKRLFCKRLTDRLLHKAISKINPEDKSIYHMLDLVDIQYPPKQYPEVHDSLLAIQKGQERSLLQQNSTKTPYLTDLLGISFSKGGTSVLADAYLVSGSLNFNQAQFAYEFGAVLQLCDDLQDVTIDKKAGHMTLFSQLFNRQKLDTILLKLIQYTTDLTSQKNNLDDIIHRNCLLLIIGSSLSTHQLISWRLRRDFSKRMPIRLKVLRQLNREFSKEMTQMKHQESLIKNIHPRSNGWINAYMSRHNIPMDSLTR